MKWGKTVAKAVEKIRQDRQEDLKDPHGRICAGKPKAYGGAVLAGAFVVKKTVLPGGDRGKCPASGDRF